MKKNEDRLVLRFDNKKDGKQYSYDDLQKLVQDGDNRTLGSCLVNVIQNPDIYSKNDDVALAAYRIYYGSAFYSTLQDIHHLDSATGKYSANNSKDITTAISLFESNAGEILSRLRKLVIANESEIDINEAEAILKRMLDTVASVGESINFSIKQSHDAELNTQDVMNIANVVRDEITEMLWEVVQEGRELMVIGEEELLQEYSKWMVMLKETLRSVCDKLEQATSGFAKIQ